MVKVLVAPDKFKGSLTAPQVCDAVSDFFSTKSNFQIVASPMADGGEGTFELLLEFYHGSSKEITVHDPLMRTIQASYGISNGEGIAFIEMAKASGLQLLKKGEYNPLATTTYGTGELIAHALNNGARTIILGIGGSATHDCGTGMASALGFRFYDNADRLITLLRGSALGNIARIDRSESHVGINRANIITLCDVRNPLTGPDGAAVAFAPQKGAAPGEVEILEKGTNRFEQLLKSSYGFNADFEGAGAAGGLGAGAAFFLNAKLKRGIDFLADITLLEQKISTCDVVITGEGKVDSQTLSGKVVQRITALAKKHNKKIIVLCGILDVSDSLLKDLGIDECLVLSEGDAVQSAMENAFELIKARLRQSKVLNAF